jgi:type I restriction enzyme S subunit
MSWPTVALGEVANLQAGVGFPPRLQGRVEGEVPFVKVGDISSAARVGILELDTARNFVSADDVLQLKARIVPKGSTLFAKIGEAISHNLRVMAGVGLLIDNNAMAAIPHGSVEPRYLFRFLETVEMYRMASSTSVPSLRKSDLERIQLPLPPLSEQRRIAFILDQADELCAKRRRAFDVAKAAAAALFQDRFGDPTQNPHRYPTVALSRVTLKIGSGATPRGGNAAYLGGDVTLIRSMNVHDNRFEFGGLVKINNVQAEALSNVDVHVDDVLLNITGASVARVAKVPSEVLPARVNQHVAVIRPDSSLDSTFLERQLTAPSLKRRLLKISSSGATREAITKAEILRLEIVLPPIELQLDFSSQVRKLESLADSQIAHLTALGELFASLQHRAFRGEL